MQEEETTDHLVKVISDLVRTKLGIGREMAVDEMYRLESTLVDVGGWPPVVICFEQSYDREAVLSKAYCLEKNGILVRMVRVVRVVRVLRVVLVLHQDISQSDVFLTASK